MLTLPISGVDYYVSNAGSDNNNGTTTGSPWATLAKVRSISFSPGDNIYFRCGDTFRDYLLITSSGVANNPITYSSYGTGAKPKIITAVNKSTTYDWSSYSGNIWRSDYIASYWADISNIIFNNEASCGWRVYSLSAVTSQGRWYFNSAERRVYLYSASNPGVYYSNIELAGVQYENVVVAYFKSNVVISNLDIRYSFNNGVFLEGCSNILVTRCDISWIGGAIFYNGPARMGNGVQIWNNASNIEVTRCYIHDIYDAGISPQGEQMHYTQQNINIHHNILVNCYYTYEVFTSQGQYSRTLINVDFCNNTCISAGGSWSAAQRPDQGRSAHIKTWGEDATLSGNDVRNNIFYLASVVSSSHYYGTPFLEDYNLYYVNTIGSFNNNNYASLSAWQSATGTNINSVSANPLFGTFYSISSNSPAVNRGTNHGYSADYYGNPIVGAPDIGAIEYQGDTEPPPIPPPGCRRIVVLNGKLVRLSGSFIVKY